VRAFFAIELDAPARLAAAQVAAELRARPGGDGVRWLRPENLHVTLRFLGEIAREQVAPLAAQVRAQTRALAPFELRLAALASLPPRGRARVLVLELAPGEPLAALAGAVERGVVAAGCAPEPRAFRAHLTLGRVRERGAPPSHAGLRVPSLGFVVTEAVLFESELQRSGSRHTPLERVPLGGAGGSRLPQPHDP
jgi:2'-5' RNA ligase